MESEEVARETTSPRNSPLLKPFIPFIILLMFSYTKDDIEWFMMYFLFSQTEYGCDFDEAFGIFLYSNAIIQLVAQPAWARLSDRYSRYSTVLLWASLLGESIIEVMMFSVPGNNFTVVMGLCLLRSIVHTENTISMWKVFKIKLDFVHFQDNYAQEKIINIIGTWGIIGEVVLDVIIFTGGYMLCTNGYSYKTAMIFVYFMTTAPSFLVWFISYVWFTPEYLEGSRSNSDTELKDSFISGDLNFKESKQKKIVKRVWESRLCHFKAIAIEKIEIQRDSALQRSVEPLGAFLYFKKALLHLYSNEICSTALIHSLFVCLFWKLMNSAVPLTLAANNMDETAVATLDTLCGGMFTNLFYQYAWNNAFYIAGATFYIVVLANTSPYIFFSKLWPLVGLFFTCCIFPLLFDVSYLIQVLLAAAVGVFPFYFYRYDEYLATATVDNEYLGVLQALFGYIRYIAPAIPGIFLAFDLDQAVFLAAFLSLFASIVYSVYVSFEYKEQLQAMAR